MKQEAVTIQATSSIVATLTQAEYHAIVRGWGIALKYGATSIFMRGASLETIINGRALIKADYVALCNHDLSVAFEINRQVHRGLKLIKGAGDVTIKYDPASSTYSFHGDHSGVVVRACPRAQPENIQPLLQVTWLGDELTKYDVKGLKRFLGKKTSNVYLAVFDDQLEQVGDHNNGTYTFTAGVRDKLTGLKPDAVLRSEVAFRYFGDKQSIHLGKIGDNFVLKVDNVVDMGVNMIILELLDVVS